MTPTAPSTGSPMRHPASRSGRSPAAGGSFTLAAALILAPLLWAHPAAAQESPSAAWQAGVVAGVPGSFSGHAFAGVEAGMFRDRWGGVVTGHYGAGNGYQSLLTGGGPAARLFQLDEFRVQGWAGAGFLREELDSGPARSSLVALLSLRVRRPLGRTVASAGLTWMGGRLDGEDFVTTAPINGVRLTLGIGF